MYEIALKLVEHIPAAFLIFDGTSREIMQGNPFAKRLFMNDGVFPSSDDLFMAFDREPLYQQIKQDLEKHNLARLYNVRTQKIQRMPELCDVEVSYLDKEKNHFFLVIRPKADYDYLDVMQELSDDLLFRIDIKSKTLFRNEKTARLHGMPAMVEHFPDNVSNSGVIHPDDLQEYMNYCHMLLQGIEGTHKSRMRMGSGNYEWHRYVTKLMYDEYGEAKEMIGKAINIQNLVDMEHKASVDLLTKTLNKIAFGDKVVELLSRSTENSRHALFFVDLDDFKRINDTLGHAFGDFLLSTVAKRLQSMVRDTDFVGRVGGDEFVVFLNGFVDGKLIEERGQMILDSLSRDYVNNLGRANISGSIGIALYPQHGMSYEELYQKADTALYHSKGEGKNIASLYHEEY